MIVDHDLGGTIRSIGVESCQSTWTPVSAARPRDDIGTPFVIKTADHAVEF
jgi:hypothetical protein